MYKVHLRAWRRGGGLSSTVLCCPDFCAGVMERWEPRGGGVVRSVVLHPAVLLDEGVDHFLHGQVGDQLVLGQGTPGDRVKMADSLHREPVTC